MNQFQRLKPRKTLNQGVRKKNTLRTIVSIFTIVIMYCVGAFTPSSAYVTVVFFMVLARMKAFIIIGYIIFVLATYHKSYIIQFNLFISILSIYFFRHISINSSYQEVFLCFIKILIISHGSTMILYYLINKVSVGTWSVLFQIMTDIILYNIFYFGLIPKTKELQNYVRSSTNAK